jgi:hypothetical protein
LVQQLVIYFGMSNTIKVTLMTDDTNANAKHRSLLTDMMMWQADNPKQNACIKSVENT